MDKPDKTDGRIDTNSTVKPDKLLSSVCNYYLNCLSLEQSSGITAFINAKDDLRYAPLSSLVPDSSDPAIAKLIKAVSTERSLCAYIGYPVIVEKVSSRMCVAPVFLYQLDISAGKLRTAEHPAINMEAVKRYSVRDANSQIYDLIELENDLGLNSEDMSIDPGDLVSRLMEIRHWDW